MQITLTQDEISTAVEEYVHNQINVAEDQEISIDFTAGRGTNGLSATLDIIPAGTAKKTSTVTEEVAKAPEPKPEAPKPAKSNNPNKLTKPAPVVEEEGVEVEEAKEEVPSPKSIFSKKKAPAESVEAAE